ncbi:GntR family transcriptional regulator [Phenylobacterium sp.]|uniref:GntR family transcriptional regulator n=1 Tax=Phenylobacterium sp. TaxID=1871053 RepID=UPI0025D041AC|nr:GntR family transcriptional regulator [Phenylobacterium sp.]
MRIEDNGVPIYVQLRDQFLRAIGARHLAPGDQMPTMRQVAVAFRIDLNTVRHAYDELERAGALVLIRGRGSFVAEAPAGLEGPDHDAEAERLARQVLATAAAAGVDPRLLAEKITALAAAKEEVR